MVINKVIIQRIPLVIVIGAIQRRGAKTSGCRAAEHRGTRFLAEGAEAFAEDGRFQDVPRGVPFPG